jgi:HSP20 family protein
MQGDCFERRCSVMKGSTLRAVKKEETPTVPVETEVAGVRGGEVVREGTLPTVFNRMERMMDDMLGRELLGRFGMPWDRFFREAGFGGEGGIRLDMFEEGGTLVVKADLPGVGKGDLSVRIMEGDLIISGERRHEEKVERKDYHRFERTVGTFSRTVPLPEGIESGAVTAMLKDGVLEVRIPRTEVKKPVVHIDIT